MRDADINTSIHVAVPMPVSVPVPVPVCVFRFIHLYIFCIYVCFKAHLDSTILIQIRHNFVGHQLFVLVPILSILCLTFHVVSDLSVNQ